MDEETAGGRSTSPRAARSACGSRRRRRLPKTGAKTTMTRDVTMLELVTALSRAALTEAEVIAAVVHLVNSGAVRLCGNFRGARFTLDDMPEPTAHAA